VVKKFNVRWQTFWLTFTYSLSRSSKSQRENNKQSNETSRYYGGVFLMRKKVDLIGSKFNKLTVIGYLGKDKNRKSLWICKCNCGNQNFLVVRGNDLISEKQKSCGCIHNIYRGLSKKEPRIYKAWINMKYRCINPHNKDFQSYGGRGIKICPEWLAEDNGFVIFCNWALSAGYKDNLTIDRIDNNGNYEPKNCRWITIKEQQNNKSSNHYIIYNKKQYTVSQLSELTGISRYKIKTGLIKGLSAEDIVAYHQKDGEAA